MHDIRTPGAEKKNEKCIVVRVFPGEKIRNTGCLYQSTCDGKGTGVFALTLF
jgi:hypothetical protein